MAMAVEQTNGHKNGAESSYTGFKEMNYLGVRTESPKKPSSESADGMQYSAFPHKQAELLRTLYGVIMEGNITGEKHQQLLLRLFRIFEREWTSVAANRKGLITQYNEWAAEWQKQFASEPVRTADEDGNTLQDVNELLRMWNSAANLLAEVYIQKKKHGLQYVRARLLEMEETEVAANGHTVIVRTVKATARDALDQARRQMDDMRFKAADLPPARQQYFWSKVQAYKLAIDRNVALALDIPVADYTDVKADLAGGMNVHLCIWRMPWAYKELYSRVFGSMADGQTMRDYLTTNQIQQWPYDRRPPSPKNKGLLGLLNREDDDDDDGDTDDRSAKDRRKDEKNDKKRKSAKGKK